MGEPVAEVDLGGGAGGEEDGVGQVGGNCG